MARAGEFKPISEMVRRQGARHYRGYKAAKSEAEAAEIVASLHSDGRRAFRDYTLVFAEDGKARS